MNVTPDLVKNVSRIARINLSEEETLEMTESFKEVLEAFSKIKEVDTENIKPSLLPIKIRNVFRTDVCENSLSQEVVLSNSKNRNGYFMGPKAV